MSSVTAKSSCHLSAWPDSSAPTVSADGLRPEGPGVGFRCSAIAAKPERASDLATKEEWSDPTMQERRER